MIKAIYRFAESHSSPAHNSPTTAHRLPMLILLLLFCVSLVFAKKVLVFDEKQGIIWVEEGKKKEGKAFEVPEIKKRTVIVEERTVRVRDHVRVKPILAEEYRQTGEKFYFNQDYIEAIKYFQKAWQAKQDPTDYFWIGACFRKQENETETARIFSEILEKYTTHETADDALFYMAVMAQKNNDYERAFDLYRQVVEMYPNGTSLIGKFYFRDEAKNQLRAMKVDLVSRLKLLGYSDGTTAELLKNFQADSKLPATAKPDKQTVELLIKFSDSNEAKMRNKIETNESVYDRTMLYLSLVCVLLLFNILWGFRNFQAIKEEANRVQLMAGDPQS